MLESGKSCIIADSAPTLAQGNGICSCVIDERRLE